MEKLKIFDKRVIRRFTVFPKLLDDGNTVTFGYYHVSQYFGIRSRGFNPTEGSMEALPRLSENYWVDIKTFKENKQ